MDEAERINSVLTGTVVERLLSDLGKRLYFPRGIVYQSVEAKRMASRFNGTVGIAVRNGEPLTLPSLQSYLPGLSSAETVDYAETQGIPGLRAAWREEMGRKNRGLDMETVSLPAVIPGLTAGISVAADLFVNPNDPVFLPDLSWDNYQLIFGTKREAAIHRYPLFNPGGAGDGGAGGGGLLNIAGMVDTIRKRAPGRKAVLLLNFPNNPTGYSPTTTEAEELAEGIRALGNEGRDILVILDDAYFGLFYRNDIYARSLFTLLSGLHERVLAVKVDGTTKEDFTWGFRIGFITFGCKGLSSAHYGALSEKLAAITRGTFSSSSRVAQSLLLKTIGAPDYRGEKERLFTLLKERFLKVSSVTAAHAGHPFLEPLPFNSGYFMSFLCKGIDAEALRRDLLEQDGIGVTAFGDRVIRIAYSSIETDDLEECFALIYAAASRIGGFQPGGRRARVNSR